MGRPRKVIPPPRETGVGARTIGYLRVSTDAQEESGAGLDAQRTAIEASAAQRGWTVEYVTETASGGRADRPVLAGVLDRLTAREADVLVVSKLDRLSRSVVHGAQTIERARAEGWTLVILDLGVDLSTPAGEMAANVILSAAQFERRMISVRTREALAALRASGVKLGRRSGLQPLTVTRILTERGDGLTLQAIADGLNRDQVATSRGGVMWRPSQVQAVLVANGTR